MKAGLLVVAIAFLAVAGTLNAQSIVNSFSTGGPFPGGLDYDSGTDTIWVADSTADTIYQFSRAGLLIQSFTSPKLQAIGVAADPTTGNVWIGDETEWVDEVDSAGVPTGRSWSTAPSITDCSGLALDPVTGNIFVSQDSGTRQIVEFTPTGTFVRSIDLTAAGSTDPDGVAYNPVTTHFFTGEDTGDQILEIDGTGKLINGWSMSGLGISPEGIGLDTVAGTVFIADGFGGMVFEVDGIIQGGPPTPSVDIKCNGGDSGVQIPAGTNAKIEFDVVAATSAGLPVDIWVVMNSPFGFLSYDGVGPIAGWSFGLNNSYYTGPLADANGTALDRPVPNGSYKAFIGIDTIPNGSLDLGSIPLKDSVDFTVF